LIHETVQAYGIDAYYLPRDTQSKVDLIFGEDPTSKFTEALPVEVYVQSVDEFEGGEFYSKFGVEVKKQARFLITTRSFEKSVASLSAANYKANDNFLLRPREGDLLWMTNFAALFEIKYADEEHFFYNFGYTKIYGYSLVCEKFRYSNELIATNIDDIDSHMELIVPAFSYIMSSANSAGTYTLGEIVYQANANATVVAWDKPTLNLTLKHINGEFVIGQPILGSDSNASYILANTSIIDDVNRRLDNNLLIEQEGESILNFSENNLFGDPQINE